MAGVRLLEPVAGEGVADVRSLEPMVGVGGRCEVAEEH